MAADVGGPGGRVYRLEPLDASGVFLGLGAVQCCLLGVGLTAAVVIVTAGIWVPMAGVPLVGAAVLSFARMGGHPAWEWLPIGATWWWGWLRRGRRWVAPLPLLPAEKGTTPLLPPCLAGLDIVEMTWRGALRLGAVRDRVRGTLTALVPAHGSGFITEAAAHQDRLVAGWGEVLAQFAVEGGVVTQLFWSDIVRPSGLATHQEWLDHHGLGHSDSVASESYRALLAEVSEDAVAHEVVVGITVSVDRAPRRSRRQAGSADHDQRSLVAAVDGLLRGLRSASLTAGDPLDASAIHRLVRSRIDPVSASRPVRSQHGRLLDRLALVTAASSGPLALETSWRHIRVDGAWHRTWWVACWPRLGVPASWLEPFLSDGLSRAMTVTAVPIAAHHARRRIERDLVKLSSDAAAKEEKGRRIDARHRRATDALLEREQELVAGHAEVAYIGLVSVAAGSEDELDEQSDVVEQLAREAGMELRMLDGRQDLAWASALPLGLAPKTFAGA